MVNCTVIVELKMIEWRFEILFANFYLWTFLV